MQDADAIQLRWKTLGSQCAMRPDILNPLFAEVEVLKGIGPALAKPLHRLGARTGSSTSCSTCR